MSKRANPPPKPETKEEKVARLMTEITERQQELTLLVLGDQAKGVSGPLKH